MSEDELRNLLVGIAVEAEELLELRPGRNRRRQRELAEFIAGRAGRVYEELVGDLVASPEP